MFSEGLFSFLGEIVIFLYWWCNQLTNCPSPLNYLQNPFQNSQTKLPTIYESLRKYSSGRVVYELKENPNKYKRMMCCVSKFAVHTPVCIVF